MRVAGLHPAQCRTELTTPSNGRSLPSCCGARLDQAGHRRPVSPELIALQGKVLGLLDPDGPSSTLSAGLPAQPVSYFADLRALGLLACLTWPAARHLSPSEEAASAIDEHVTSLRRQAADWQGVSLTSASRARFDSPSMDAAASGGLAHIADCVLDGSIDEVREQLRLLLPAGRRESRAFWGLRVDRSATPCSEGLHAAYAPLLRGFTKAGSQPTGRRNAVFHPQRWGPENIPAFLPESWYDRHFTTIDGVSPRIIRRTAALRLVQMAAGGSLGEAAGFLGIASRARRQPELPGFETALEALARELDDPATPLVSYRQRRQALETWCIDLDTWAGLIARLQAPHWPEPGACMRQVASIYLWVQLTSGEHRFAPRPLEAAQPPEVQEAWKGGRRSAIWIRMHRSQPGSHYASLKAELNALSTSLARSIDPAAEPDHDVEP